jgi:capsular polysaccharide biosynthesis protein
MNYKSRPEDLQLVDYVGVLRRRWWLIVVLTIIGTVGGIGYIKVVHKVYSATAAVYVTATSATANQVANGRTTGTVNLDTEAQVVESATVAQAAAKLMHSTESPQQITKRVSVTVPANSQVLSISCQATSAVKAAACAESFAQAYLKYSSAKTTAAINSQLSTLQSRISTLESASAKLTIEASGLPNNSSQRAAAEEQLNSDHSQLSSLNSEVAQLTTDLADPASGSIISNATPPSAPASPKSSLVLPSGLLVGLLIGLVLAFIVDRGDRRIRGPRDVSRFDVPVLMSFPRKRFTLDLAIAAPRSRVGRDFSELAHVLTGALGAGGHVILITGSSAGEGASLVAANLAVALSRNQSDVILVCANVEGSPIPGMLGVPSEPGLTDVLADDVSAAYAGQRPAAVPRLQVITPGSAARGEAEDFQQDAVDSLLNGLRRKARWVVVEAPSVTSGPDVYTLAHAADAAVLVAELPRTRRDQVLGSIQHLDRTGTTVLGVALLPSPKALGKRGSTPVAVAGSNGRPARRAPSPATASDSSPVAVNGTGNIPNGIAYEPSGEVGDEDATTIFERPAFEEAPNSAPRN